MSPKTSNKEIHFKNSQGHKIFCKHWEAREDPPEALIYLVHGFGEHILVYDSFAHELIGELNVFVFGHDHSGHGKSEGPRGYTPSLDHYVDDGFAHIDMAREKYPDQKLFLFGHSMGGTVCVKMYLKKPKYFKGMVLSGPGLRLPKRHQMRYSSTVVKMIAPVWPSLPLTTTAYAVAVRDSEEVQKCHDDPNYFHGWLRAGFLQAMFKAFDEIESNLKKINIPFFIVHGGADKVCDVSASEEMYKAAPSKDKSFKVYPDACHNLFSEVEGNAQTLFYDIICWYAERI